MFKNLFIFLTIMAVLLGTYLFYGIYNKVEKQSVEQMLNQQEIYARQASRGMMNFFDDCKSILTEIAGRPGVKSMTGNYKKEIQNIYESFQNKIIAVTRVDKNGVLAYTYPYDKSFIGLDLSRQEHNAKIIKIHQPVISDVLTTVQGYRAVVYAYPVMHNGEYNGCISFVIPFRFIAKEFIEEIKIGNEGYAFVLSEEGTILYHPNEKIIGENASEFFTIYPGVLELTNKMTSAEQGSLEYQYVGLNADSSDVIMKKAFYTPVFIEDTFWSIAVTVSENELLSINRDFRDDFILIMVFLIVLLIAFISLYFITKDLVRRKMEDEAEKYKIVTEKTGQIIYEAYIDTGKINWGGAIEVVSGFTKKEFEKFSYSDWLERVHPEDRDEQERILTAAKENGQEYTLEYRFLKKEGIYIYIEEKGMCKKDSSGDCVLMLGALKDIDLKKKAVVELSRRKSELEKIVEERTLELKETNEILMQDLLRKRQAHEALMESKLQAEKSDRLKSEFLAQMSHEIRTPINTILNFSSLIESEFKGKLNDDLGDSFQIMSSAGNRIIRTIDLILDMSQLQTDSYETNLKQVDLDTEVLKKLILEYEILASDKGIELAYNREVETANVFADQYTTQQIFDNLIDNAIKYTSEGRIDITIKQNENDEILVSVRDTGIGIAEDYLPDIFKPFSQEEQGYTRKFEGNGLGLALVKKYCEMNGADIYVESQKGEGSCFTVIFRLMEIN